MHRSVVIVWTVGRIELMYHLPPLGGGLAGSFFSPFHSDITVNKTAPLKRSLTGRNMQNHQLWLQSQIFQIDCMERM